MKKKPWVDRKMIGGLLYCTVSTISARSGLSRTLIEGLVRRKLVRTDGRTWRVFVCQKDVTRLYPAGKRNEMEWRKAMKELYARPEMQPAFPKRKEEFPDDNDD